MMDIDIEVNRGSWAPPLSMYDAMISCIEKQHSHENSNVLEKITLDKDGKRPAFNGSGLAFSAELADELTTSDVDNIINGNPDNVYTQYLGKNTLKYFYEQHITKQFIKANKLQEIVDTALGTAKESGEFNGKDGDSAYQIWLDNGHEGTEEDFLDWLKADSSGSAGTTLKVAEFDKEHFKFWEGTQGSYVGFISDIEPSEKIPENAAVVDIGIVVKLTNDEGDEEEKEYRSAHIQSEIGFGEKCQINVYPYPYATDSNFSNEYQVARFYEDNISASPLYGKTSIEDYKKVKVYYLGG